MFYIYDPGAKQVRDLGEAMNWSTIELGFAIVCACLPTYGPLLTAAALVPNLAKIWYTSLLGSFTGLRSIVPRNAIRTVRKDEESRPGIDGSFGECVPLERVSGWKGSKKPSAT